MVWENGNVPERRTDVSATSDEDVWLMVSVRPSKLYLLALTDIPFRIYFWIGVPVDVFFRAPPGGSGGASQTEQTFIRGR